MRMIFTKMRCKISEIVYYTFFSSFTLKTEKHRTFYELNIFSSMIDSPTSGNCVLWVGHIQLHKMFQRCFESADRTSLMLLHILVDTWITENIATSRHCRWIGSSLQTKWAQKFVHLFFLKKRKQSIDIDEIWVLSIDIKHYKIE